MEDPGFMLESCPESCSRPENESNFVSLYDIVETDINGKEFSFDMFKGSIVYIVNVASQCGYTAENYEMFRKLSKYSDDGVYMVLAPCNQVTVDHLFVDEPKGKYVLRISR
jgi:glutathione peroxidase-family protein